MSEMTHNQALQELTRFTRVWQAASQLAEALQVAASIESATEQMETERRNLEDKVHRMEALVSERQKESREAIQAAEAELQEKLEGFERNEAQRSREHAETLTTRERQVQAALARLESELAAARQGAHEVITALDKEIAEKQALVGELDAQIEALRRRFT